MAQRRFSLARAATLMGGAIALALPAAAQAPALAMLDGLDRGGWEVRWRDDGSSQRVCLRSGRELVQLRHPQGDCPHFVLQDDPAQVTVQYTCRGQGYGRTILRREGRGLVQVRTEGISAGAPFSLEGEARRTGAC